MSFFQFCIEGFCFSVKKDGLKKVDPETLTKPAESSASLSVAQMMEQFRLAQRLAEDDDEEDDEDQDFD